MLNHIPDLTNVSAQTINYEVYYGIAAQRFLGTSSIDLPEIVYESQDVKGAGIQGTINYPTQTNTESMQVTLHWRSLTRESMFLMKQQAHDLTLRAAVDYYDIAADVVKVVPIKIEFRGKTKKTGTGKFEPSEFMESETEFEIIQLKITIDGEVVYEVDKLNYISKNYEEDFALPVRTALGL